MRGIAKLLFGDHATPRTGPGRPGRPGGGDRPAGGPGPGDLPDWARQAPDWCGTVPGRGSAAGAGRDAGRRSRRRA